MFFDGINDFEILFKTIAHLIQDGTRKVISKEPKRTGKHVGVCKILIKQLMVSFRTTPKIVVP